MQGGNMPRARTNHLWSKLDDTMAWHNQFLSKKDMTCQSHYENSSSHEGAPRHLFSQMFCNNTKQES